MKEIKFTSNFGNIDYELRAEVDDDTLLALAGKGLGQIAQRSPCTDAEKALAGHLWAKNRRGEPSRPQGFERSSIAYSKENAAVLKAHLEAFKNKDNVKLSTLYVRVSEHESAKAESKWAKERAQIESKNGDAERLGKLARKVGYDFDDASELTVENVDFCSAIRDYIKEIERKAMAEED